jgi:anti-sigma factor RsiW
VHLSTGARALDALPTDERLAFDEHLLECDSCAAEYAGFLETTTLLAAAVAEPAPADLEARLVRLIAVTAQLPPPGRAAGAAPEHSTDSAPWYRHRWVMAVAAAVVGIAVVTGVVVAVRGSTGQHNVADAKACVEQAPDAEITTPSVGNGGQVTVAPSCHAAIVALPTLPGLPPTQGYQLWVMAGNAARSVGMVQGQVATGGTSVVTGLQAGDTDVGISVEPSTGSKSPTTQPVWVVPLSG